jgi:hypothetical protein
VQQNATLGHPCLSALHQKLIVVVCCTIDMLEHDRHQD